MLGTITTPVICGILAEAVLTPQDIGVVFSGARDTLAFKPDKIVAMASVRAIRAGVSTRPIVLTTARELAHFSLVAMAFDGDFLTQAPQPLSIFHPHPLGGGISYPFVARRAEFRVSAQQTLLGLFEGLEPELIAVRVRITLIGNPLR